MSLLQNTTYLESMQQNLEIAIFNKDVKMVQTILDTMNYQGRGKAAQELATLYKSDINKLETV